MNTPRKSISKNKGISLVEDKSLEKELLFLENKNNEWTIDLIEMRRRAEVIAELKKRTDYISALVINHKELDDEWEDNDKPHGWSTQIELSKKMQKIWTILNALWLNTDWKLLDSPMLQKKVSNRTAELIGEQQSMSL